MTHSENSSVPSNSDDQTITRRDAVKLAGAGIVAASGLSNVYAGSHAEKGLNVKLPELPYAHDALAPHIDARTMEIHHGKHHAGYTRKFNAALEGLSGYKSPEGVVRDLNSTPAEVRTSLRNNGGGYWNHSLFWEVLAPEGSGGDPSGDLHEAIKSAFGSLDAMKEAFNKAAASRFGSGWAWLIYDRTANLAVTSTPNQDNPLMEGIVPDGDLGQPILGLDVWEHAYYLNYQNRRGDYVKSFWNIVNWNKVNELFAEC